MKTATLPAAEKPKRVRPSRSQSRTAGAQRPGPVTQDPPAGEVVADPPPGRVVGGLKVIADEPVATNLPRRAGTAPIHLKGFTKLTLEDHTVLYACTSCDYTGQRGEVIRHRAEQHGAAMGGRRKGVQYDRPTKPDYAAAMEMALGELLELAVDINNTGVIIECLTSERDELRERLSVAEQTIRRYKRGFDALGFVPREDDVA